MCPFDTFFFPAKTCNGAHQIANHHHSLHSLCPSRRQLSSSSLMVKVHPGKYINGYSFLTACTVEQL